MPGDFSLPSSFSRELLSSASTFSSSEPPPVTFGGFLKGEKEAKELDLLRLPPWILAMAAGCLGTGFVGPLVCLEQCQMSRYAVTEV